MRFVFINSDGIVVQVIIGELNEQQQAQFLRDYAILFGATQIVAVDAETSVWIGGSYTDGTFTEPPAPEPLPEPLPEVVTETI
jgi:hypothetical protein